MASSTTKKRIVLYIVFFVVVVILCILATNLFKKKKITNEPLMASAAKLDSFDADVIVLGNLDNASVDINFRRAEKLTQEVLSEKGTNGYHILVLYDCDGKLNLSQNDINLIKKYCEEEHFDMLYLGMEHMQAFHEYGLISYKTINETSFLYQGYKFRNGNPYKFDGEVWVNEETGAFNSNPFIMFGPWTSFPGTSPNADSVWADIIFMALYSIEN